MPDVLALGGLISFVGILAYLLRGENVRRKSLRRLRVEEDAIAERAAAAAAREEARVVPLVSRYYIWPWLTAVTLGLGSWLLLGMRPLFAVAIGVIAGLLLLQLETFWADRRTAAVEAQLADAIDLMVGALHAGASATVAMDRAADESSQPLKGLFKESLARIRFGDDAPSVMRRLQGRVATETFRLFATTMSVHFEVGGSLAPTLSTVGRVIRDRIEVSRRVRSLTAQARVSTVMLLLTTYFIALLMWRQDPQRVRNFVASPIGSIAVAGSMVLQAVGVVWQTLASRVRF